MTSFGINKHGSGERLNRHRHAEGYAAIVLAGGYTEAGNRGRRRVQAGDVLVHWALDAHQDEFCKSGAVVLNLPLARGLRPTAGTVEDPDAIARAAERDLGEAAEMVSEGLRPTDAKLEDWPDLLAAELASAPDFRLSLWAERMGLAPQSVSRGFRRAYGTSPKVYRAEQRALAAVRALPGWHGPLAALAADLGFADQSHLTRAVGSLTGLSPTRLRVQSVQD